MKGAYMTRNGYRWLATVWFLAAAFFAGYAVSTDGPGRAVFTGFAVADFGWGLVVLSNLIDDWG